MPRSPLRHGRVLPRFLGACALWALLLASPGVVEAAAAAKSPWSVRQLSYAPGLEAIVTVSGRKAGEPVVVQVLKDGKPASGVKVEFRIVSAPAKARGAKLSDSHAITDAKGKAKVYLQTGSRAGPYLVAAYLNGSVRDHPAVVTRFNAMSTGWLLLLLVGLFGGLGLFLYGMTLAGDNLQRAAGDKMRTLLGSLARDRVRGVLLGTVASGVLQSSSATTVMLVGFVSATMMTLAQAISVTMGAKIGTTITVQLIAFKISKYALALVAVGVIMMMVAGRRQRIKTIGSILLGFGLLFFGLSLMSTAMKPLRGMPEFTNLLLGVKASPALAIVIGTLFTAIIQSSAATIALCMALASQGLIPLSAAIPLSIGAAIGTCATALLASLGATRDGKRVAVAHLLYSVLAALLIFPFLGVLTSLTVEVSSWMGSTSVVRQIANGFMLFSILAALVFLPFVTVLEWVVRWMIPTAKGEAPFGPIYINETSLNVPVLALEQAHKEVERMAELLHENLKAAMPAIEAADDAELQRLIAEDDKLDVLERAIRPFLAKVSQTGLAESVATRERGLIYITEHLEGGGDLLAKEVLHTAARLTETGGSFSAEGIAELKQFHEKIVAKSERILRAVRDSDRTVAEESLQLAFKEAQLERKLRESHLVRLQAGGDDSVQSSRAHLTILAGLQALGAKFSAVADEILREM